VHHAWNKQGNVGRATGIVAHGMMEEHMYMLAHQNASEAASCVGLLHDQVNTRNHLKRMNFTQNYWRSLLRLQRKANFIFHIRIGEVPMEKLNRIRRIVLDSISILASYYFSGEIANFIPRLSSKAQIRPTIIK
jgi:hypothetical protein